MTEQLYDKPNFTHFYDKCNVDKSCFFAKKNLKSKKFVNELKTTAIFEGLEVLPIFDFLITLDCFLNKAGKEIDSH